MTKAIKVLLLKPGKDPLDHGSYRPISLLQTDVLAKVLAIRLNKVISSIIHSDQAGFMPREIHGYKSTQAVYQYTVQV